MLKEHKNIGGKKSFWGLNVFPSIQKSWVQKKWLIRLNLYKYFLKDMHMQDSIR